MKDSEWRYCYECRWQESAICKCPEHIRYDMLVETEEYFMAEGCRPSEMNEVLLSSIVI